MVLVVVMTFGVISAIADFGDFSGDSDYGGGSDSGSSWSSSDSYYGDSSGSGGSITGGPAALIFILVAGGFVVVAVLGNKSRGGASRPAGATAVDASMLRFMFDYAQRDPSFSEPALCERISNLYVQMQNCWTAKNMEPLRPYFTATSFAQFDRQLDSYRQNYRTNFVERISVLGVELRGWYEQENNDCIVANVRTRIVDYTVDDRSGNVISGSRTAEKFMTYEYILIRSSGFVTNVQDRDASTINCPNCAAPLNINQSAQCQFCGSVVTTKDYDWVISSIKGISQVTGH